MNFFMRHFVVVSGREKNSDGKEGADIRLYFTTWECAAQSVVLRPVLGDVIVTDGKIGIDGKTHWDRLDCIRWYNARKKQ